MVSISCENINIAFGSDEILKSVSFSLNYGEKMGIVGVNGAGKTTLFKIITGEYSQTGGNIYIAKDKTIGILAQEKFFDESRTVLNEAYFAKEDLIKTEKELESLRNAVENGNNELAEKYSIMHDYFVKNGGYEFRGRVKGALKYMGFGEDMWDKRIFQLSGGQKTRLAMVKMILKEPDIMLLDEPTNHLDTYSVEWLEDFLHNYKKTVIVVSHDRYFLDKTVKKILEIENGIGKLYKGNYTEYVGQKKIDRDVQQKHYLNQQKEITRIEKYIEQQRRWNRERNIIAAESRQKMLDKMEKISKPDKLPDSIKVLFKSAKESGNDVVRIKNISKLYGNTVLFSDLNFEVHRGEHLFITGKNGCGKSTLIKIIAERMKSDSGCIEYGYNVKVGYYDQENQDIFDDNTVIDELWNSHDDLTQTEIRNALALFNFKGDDIFKKVSVLSGGEKARLTICKLILSKTNLLILDEPTNHLDINSREALEDALSSYDGTIIAVSHDRYFLSKLANRFLYFSDNGIKSYIGTYDEYCSYRSNSEKEELLIKTRNTVSSSKEDYLQNKKEQSEMRKQERKIKLAKEECEKIESELEKIDDEIQKYATDYIKTSELWLEKEKLEDRLLELYEFLETDN